MLGLGNNLKKSGLISPGIVTDNLVLKHNYNAASVVPVSDGAAYFQGGGTDMDDYIDLGSSSSLMSTGTNITLSAWFRVVDGDNGRIISFQRGSGSSALGLVVNYTGSENDGYITFLTYNGSGHNWLNYDGNVDTSGKWHHIAGTTTSSAQVLYLDGVAVNDSSNTFVNDTDSNIATIGALNGVGTFFGGYICNVGIWDAVLTQPQIKSIMNKNYAGLTSSEKTNLVSWWNLDSKTEFDAVGTNTTSTPSIAYDGIVIDNNDITVGSELLTGFTIGTTYPYDTFTSSGRGISAAIETSGDWGGCASNALSITAGEWYKCTFDLTYNSGTDDIRMALVNGLSGASSAHTNYTYTSANGTNTMYFKVTATDASAYLQIGTGASADVINFSMSNISLKKMNGNHGALS